MLIFVSVLLGAPVAKTDFPAQRSGCMAWEDFNLPKDIEDTINDTMSAYSFRLEGDTLILDFGDVTAELPEKLNSGSELDHTLKTTGVFVSEKLAAVSVYDKNKQCAKVFVTADRGENWTLSEIDLGFGKENFSVYKIYPTAQFISFSSAEHGVLAVTHRGMGSSGNTWLFATSDGGKSWTRSDSEEWSGNMRVTYGVGFIDELHGFVSCGSALKPLEIRETTDGGATWQALELAEYLPDELGEEARRGAFTGSPYISGQKVVFPIVFRDGERPLCWIFNYGEGWKFSYDKPF